MHSPTGFARLEKLDPCLAHQVVMSEHEQAVRQSGPLARFRTRVAVAALALLAISAIGAYVATRERAAPVERVAPPASGAPTAAEVGWASAAEPVPDIRFQDADGRALALADFRGKVILLNVWATWCVPCREEMPALDRLQQQLGGSGFEVVALSIDTGGIGAVKRFYDEIGVRSLKMYLDPSMQATGPLRVVGLPTTLLIDREGRERWRKIGPAEWDAARIVESLRLRLRESAGSGG